VARCLLYAFEKRKDGTCIRKRDADSCLLRGRWVSGSRMKRSGGRFWDTRITEAENMMRVERHELIDNWTRIKSQWILIGDDDSVQRFEYHVRIYSGQELTDLLREAGFVDVALYGDLDGRSYGPGATRLIALARKA
jgi:hypothetical protein